VSNTQKVSQYNYGYVGETIHGFVARSHAHHAYDGYRFVSLLTEAAVFATPEALHTFMKMHRNDNPTSGNREGLNVVVLKNLTYRVVTLVAEFSDVGYQA
jgi:hypothetical protein